VTQTWDDYTAKAAAVLAPLGVSVTGIHSVADPVAAIAAAEVVIVGGGNTFQLLKECRGRGLLAPIVDVVQRGACTSAGARAQTSPARPSAPPTICRLSIRRV
jgi:dipeptidase E